MFKAHAGSQSVRDDEIHSSDYAQPVRIFEIGPCFRKESQGAQHLNEFTMLNLVEFAEECSEGQMNRLKELLPAPCLQQVFQVTELEITTSEVYGETLDVVKDQVELGSGAYGPHPWIVNGYFRYTMGGYRFVASRGFQWCSVAIQASNE